ADVVAHIICDDGRIARIVLRNARLHLADEVGADVGALSKDAAAQAGEDRDQRAPEAERDDGIDDGAVIGREAERPREEAEIERDAEEGERGHQEAGDGAGFERDVETTSARADTGPP